MQQLQTNKLKTHTALSCAYECKGFYVVCECTFLCLVCTFFFLSPNSLSHQLECHCTSHSVLKKGPLSEGVRFGYLRNVWESLKAPLTEAAMNAWIIQRQWRGMSSRSSPELSPCREEQDEESTFQHSNSFTRASTSTDQL